MTIITDKQAAPFESREASMSEGVAAVQILVRSDQSHLLTRIKDLLLAHHGTTPVLIQLTDLNQRRIAPKSHWVAPNSILLSDLRMLLGADAVVTKPITHS